jgi:hypothetical protein
MSTPQFSNNPPATAGNFGLEGDNVPRQGNFGAVTSTGFPIAEQNRFNTLTNNLSTRYDAFRGLLSSPNDMRANLLLNAIEDAQSLNRISRNLNPEYFGDAPIATNACAATVAGPVVDFLLEIKGRLTNPTNQSVNEASAAISAVNAMTSSGLPTGTSIVLNEIASRLYQNNADGSVVPRSDAFQSLLELLILNGDCQAALNRAQALPASTTDRFATFLPNKLALQKFLEATEEANRFAIASPSADAAPEAVVPENVFYKKVGQPGKTFTLDANGNETEVQAGSAVYQQLNQANQCYGTGLVATPDECNNYFTKCLAGKDIQACKDFMENANFWQNSENAVSSMLPDVLLATLDSFGFKAYDSKTSTGRNYRAYPSAEEWITTLKASLGDDDGAQGVVDSVRGNARLMGYLNMIVTRVNSNPGIANPTYVEDGPSYNPNAFVGTLGSQYGIKGKAFAPRSSKARPAPTPTAVSALENTVVNYMGPLGLTYGITPLTAGFPIGIQKGGADELDVSSEKRLPLKVSDQLNEMYESILENLQHGGKDLDGGDQETIKKMINELNVLENKLFKSSSYVQGYEDLISTQAGGSLVTESNLEKFVAKRNDYFNRVNAKYQSIFPIFSKLAEACQKETVNSADVVTAEYYPKA